MAEYTSGFTAATPEKKEEKLSQRWQRLDSKKGDMLRRNEDYARWTLPYIFPIQGTENTERNGPIDSTGARAVNHLSNKLIMTLFQPHQPFFRLLVSDDVLDEFSEQADAGDQEAKEILSTLDKSLAKAEKQAMKELDYNKYRTEATMASKTLIVTGNALIYHPDKGKGKAQCYNVRDYCVVRDLSGNVIEIITRDKKAFYTFSKRVQDALKASKNKKYDKEHCDVTLYTQVELKEDGKFHLTQYADDVKLDSAGSWPIEELPWIALTWNLVRGEDYGRGLVEDYAGAFHALYVLNNSLVDMVGIAADIKFFVDPSSVIDVVELNKAESGTYHSGKKDDLSTFELGKVFDIQFVENAIQRFQTQIAQAFLLNSSVTRDAERVTAEEVRFVAQELELSHGGIYSRFAEEWQYRTAVILLKRIKVNIGKGETVYPQIITGLDSLSRAGDLDNLRLFMSDLAMLNEVPEEFRAVIDPAAYAAFIGTRRGVDYEKIIKAPAQIQAENQQMMDAQNGMADQEATRQMAVKAGEAAMKEE